ncbi:hypothetical protein CEW83_02415 [Parazoarcus communis]|uniref:SnoaL-like domain-containing protein n=1 Tax=Parazoarcus communis TaxID=41977 RepID=A0A2U8GLZ8_9RHOO|nr:hypothetical protein [Parazoarcus communis]AWI74213.1 hypothetical protein CEW83_02415 [Parazoarcus communis]
MGRVDPAAIERFMRGQVTCWNAHDKPGFMAHYRSVASEALDIAYAGRDEQQDGWFVIEEMWDKHNERFELEVLNTIINGDDVAVHHRNCIRGTDLVIESIETYRFSPGRLSVCYFLQPPSSAEVDLAQFRGFA